MVNKVSVPLCAPSSITHQTSHSPPSPSPGATQPVPLKNNFLAARQTDSNQQALRIAHLIAFRLHEENVSREAPS